MKFVQPEPKELNKNSPAIHVRLSRMERAMLTALSQKYGIRTAELIRQMIVNAWNEEPTLIDKLQSMGFLETYGDKFLNKLKDHHE